MMTFLSKLWEGSWRPQNVSEKVTVIETIQQFERTRTVAKTVRSPGLAPWESLRSFRIGIGFSYQRKALIHSIHSVNLMLRMEPDSIAQGIRRRAVLGLLVRAPFPE
jgi:hypothetical protein